jgi:hypothetical protein
MFGLPTNSSLLQNSPSNKYFKPFSLGFSIFLHLKSISKLPAEVKYSTDEVP